MILTILSFCLIQIIKFVRNNFINPDDYLNYHHLEHEEENIIISSRICCVRLVKKLNNDESISLLLDVSIPKKAAQPTSSERKKVQLDLKLFSPALTNSIRTHYDEILLEKYSF